MKLIVSLFFALGLLSISSASLSPDEAKANVISHIEPQIYNLLSRPGVARAGGGIKCYDKYLPLITEATENSKTDTQACISRAASRREDELNKVKSERESLDSQVQNVEETLSACLKKTDDLEYLKCLKDNSLNLQNALNEVGKTSESLSDNLSASYKNIDIAEDTCIKAVIAKSKSVSDELLAALQNCLMNGLDDGGSDGGSGGGANGGADGGSDGSSNGGSDNGANGDADGGSDGDSNNGSNDSSNGGSNNGSDGGSNNGSDGGSNNGSSDGSDNETNGDSNGGSNGDANGGSNDSTDNNSDGGSNGGSDSGAVPNSDVLPEEDLTP